MFYLKYVSGSSREMSARTKRAQRFNNAYLRSTGMGKYTPHVANPHEQNYHNKDKDWGR